MTKREQELSKQLFGGQERSTGALEAIKEGLTAFRDAMYPGLTWDKITSDLGKEVSRQVGAGAHELAAALFNGNGFVMYQRDGKEDQPAQEQAQDAQDM
jgi:hypothetical protein